MKLIVGGEELGGVVISLSSDTHDDDRAGAGAGAGAGASVNTGSVESRMVAEFRPIMDVTAMDIGWNATVLRALEDELRGYSITPTTLKSRVYESSLDDVIYEDTYSFGTANVTRFGINTHAPLLRPKTAKGDTDTSHTTNYSSKSGTKLLNAVAQIKHEDVEVEVLQKAVGHLLAHTDTHAVLVDIIARDGYCLSINEVTGGYEIHTVILYKNPPNAEGKHSITVIDPSNVAFSAHLGNVDIVGKYSSSDGDLTCILPPKLADDKLLVRNGSPEIIILSKTKEKVYQAPPSDKVGPLPGQFRDCIDIAVKLGLGFNTSGTTYDKITNRKQLQGNDVVQRVTNNLGIDKDLPEGDYGPLRCKQNSDTMVQQRLAKLNEALDDYAKCAETLVKVSADNVLLTFHESTLREADGHDDLHKFCPMQVLKGKAMLAGLLETHSTEVVGEILSIGGEDHE